MEAREILIYFALKHNGDWQSIYNELTSREKINRTEAKEYLKTLNCRCVTILDEDFPDELKKIMKPPFVLFYYGDIGLINQKEKLISVVGSRHCSSYAEKATKDIVSELASENIIISGLAIGVDTIAHESALNNNGKTVAILGSGIDNCYPKSNLIIYEKIKENGLLISEYPAKTPPKSEHFPFRNRLIAALSWGVLIPESKSKSGTSVTISHAIQLGKEIMCVPHSYHEYSYNNLLIREGATLIENAEQVIEQRPKYFSEKNISYK
ncbi:MAG: DNA-processing protein DprA [Erysipelotrichaceae bacterium]|jgi:DNA processing protein|nr:DNA-processing protein DprA [Erysipelotrichaceae bacterium]